MEIANKSEIVNELAEMMMQFDKERRRYCTDVYLYYDAENKTARLSLFENPGGQSWIDDDHITIYTDNEHFNTAFEFFDEEQEVNELAECIGISVEEMRNAIANEYDLTNYKLTYDDAKKWIEGISEYMDKISESYDLCIDNLADQYIATAQGIIEAFENEH